MTPECDDMAAYQLNRWRIWRIIHGVRGSSMAPNKACTVPWRGAIVRAYMGWHWLKRYGNCLPCVCLWEEDQQVPPGAIKPHSWWPYSISKNCSATASLLDSYVILTETFVPCTIGREKGTCRADPITGCFSLRINYTKLVQFCDRIQPIFGQLTDAFSPSTSAECILRSPESNLI